MTSRPRARTYVRTDAENAALRAEVVAAPVLPLADHTLGETGVMLHVATIGCVTDPVTFYLRTANGRTYRIPLIGHPWAEAFLALHLRAVNHGEPADGLLPCLMGFGVDAVGFRVEIQDTTE